MRKEASLPIRLDPDDKRRLLEVAERMGLTVSALVRLLVRSFVEEYDRCGGRVALPPRWYTGGGAEASGADGEALGMPKAAESGSKYADR